MPLATEMPLALNRNGDYQDTWYITNDDDTPYDLTGCTVEMDVKAVADVDADPLVSLTDTGSLTVTGFKLPADPTEGWVTVTIKGADLSSVGRTQQPQPLVWDFRITAANGIRDVMIGGPLTYAPGVTA
jgi:hypothetical protein